MALDERTVEQARQRIAQVFRYLQELNLHRNPAKRLIQDQPWRLSLNDLPDHPSIQRVLVDTTSDVDGEGEATPPYLVKVHRELLDRVLRRAEALRLEWLEGGNGDEAPEVAGPAPLEPTSGQLSADEDRVLEALRVSGRPLGKSQTLARARISEAAWGSTIASLRRRGLVIQEGTRRGATYRLATTDRSGTPSTGGDAIGCGGFERSDCSAPRGTSSTLTARRLPGGTA